MAWYGVVGAEWGHSTGLTSPKSGGFHEVEVHSDLRFGPFGPKTAAFGLECRWGLATGPRSPKAAKWVAWGGQLLFTGHPTLQHKDKHKHKPLFSTSHCLGIDLGKYMSP